MSDFVQMLDLPEALVEFKDLGSVSKPTLVFIHGCPSDYQEFSKATKHRLEASFRIITYSRPGFGRSVSKVSKIWALDDQVRLLKNILERLEVRRPLIMSHSMGARIAVEYANQFSENCRALILISPFLFSAETDESKQGLLKILRSPFLGTSLLQILSKFVGEKAVRKNLYQSSFPQPVDMAWIESTAFRYSMPQTIQAILEEKEALLRSPFKQLPTTMPVTILGGPQDRVAEKSKQMDRINDRSKLIYRMVDNGLGHRLAHISVASLNEALNFIQTIEGDQHATAQGI